MKRVMVFAMMAVLLMAGTAAALPMAARVDACAGDVGGWVTSAGVTLTERCEAWKAAGVVGVVNPRSVLGLSIHTLATDTNGGALPIPSSTGTNWTANEVLRNTSTSTVTQKVGHFLFTHPGFDPIVIEPTVTVEPGETYRIPNAGANYDPGFWIQTVDARLESSVALTYGAGIGSTNFETDAVDRPFTTAGQKSEYHRIITDAAEASASGAWFVVMNTNSSSVSLDFRVFASKKGPDGTYAFVDEYFNAPAGVSLKFIGAARPSGATVMVCDLDCAVGLPGTSAPVYVLGLTGRDGSVRAPRYPFPVTP